MKGRLWCKLFGHRFVAIKEEDDGYVIRNLTEWCMCCGLTKEEVGIK